MGEHDDHVNALLVALYYIYEQMGMKNILIPQKSANEQDVTQKVTKEDLRQLKKDKAELRFDQETQYDNERYFQKFIY